MEQMVQCNLCSAYFDLNGGYLGDDNNYYCSESCRHAVECTFEFDEVDHD